MTMAVLWATAGEIKEKGSIRYALRLRISSAVIRLLGNGSAPPSYPNPLYFFIGQGVPRFYSE